MSEPKDPRDYLKLAEETEERWRRTGISSDPMAYIKHHSKEDVPALVSAIRELVEERERHLRALELCAEEMQRAGLDASNAVRELHKAGRLER